MKAMTNNDESSAKDADARVGDGDVMVVIVVVADDSEASIGDGNINDAVANHFNGDGCSRW